MADDHNQRLERTASAIEDLLQMGAIRFQSEKEEKAMLSPQFSQVASNVMSEMKITDTDNEQAMKLMYYSLLIFMNEYLKMPKALMMAFGNDLEKNRETMESGELVTRYVSILTELWTRNRRESSGT
ncbi:MAG TPA: hypothetical protein VH621_03635 [Nitrososphaera sp.]|jgi:hypothetical protein